MASPAWKGGATPAVAQVWKGTITTTTNGHTYIVTLTDEAGGTVAITYTVANPPDTTTTLVATGFITAWNASTDTRIAAITATQNAGQVILTADTAGVPFSVAASGTGTWSGTGNTTSNTGRNDWNTAANWSLGAVPVGSDTVTIDGRGGSTSANAILYGLDQSAVTLASLRVFKSAPPIGTVSAALKISATILDIGLPTNDGSSAAGSFTNINTGTNATTTSVYDSPNTGSSGFAPVTLQGNHASNVLNIYGGIVGAGLFIPAATNTYPTINVVKGQLSTGTATDWTAANVNGGSLTLGKGASSGTLTTNGGTTTVNGATKVGTLTMNGGTVRYNARLSGDDLGTWNFNGGAIDFSGDAALINATAWNLKKGGTMTVASASQFTAITTTPDATNGINLTVKVAA